jgi:hypothetical protein
MLANELFVCSVIFIPNKENRSRLFNAMVCGQKNIDHQTDAGSSGFRCTLWVRLGTMLITWCAINNVMHYCAASYNNGANYNTSSPDCLIL